MALKFIERNKKENVRNQQFKLVAILRFDISFKILVGFELPICF